MTPRDANSLKVGDRQDEIAAFVALMRSGVAPAYKVATIAEEIGSAVRLLQLTELDRFRSIDDGSHLFIGAVSDADLATAWTDVAEWFEEELDVRSILDPHFPYNLKNVFDRPPLLFFSGEWNDEIDSRAIAVVGTRHPSAEGIRLAREITREIAGANFTILSGLAEGIDTVAHETTLQEKKRTVAVIGTGLRHVYPKKNIHLVDRILKQGGAIISSFFPDQPPEKWTFPARNVVTSGLALATVVVEASETSGAKMQARLALQHGRAVFLPRSLVRQHEWADEYVRLGKYETQAIEFDTPDEIVRRIDSDVLSIAASE